VLSQSYLRDEKANFGIMTYHFINLFFPFSSEFTQLHKYEALLILRINCTMEKNTSAKGSAQFEGAYEPQDGCKGWSDENGEARFFIP
jgi:hypothetical protein